MKESMVKKSAVCLLGLIMAQAGFFGCNPVAVAYFTTVYHSMGQSLFVFGAVTAGLFLSMPVVTAAKYVFIMVMILVISHLIEWKEKKLGIVAYGIIAGGCTAVMGISAGFVQMNVTGEILMSLAEAAVVCCLTGIFYRSVDFLLYGEAGKRADNEEMAGLAVMIGIAALGIPRELIVDYGILEAVMFFGIAYFGYAYGIGTGALVGTTCGVIQAIWQNDVMVMGAFCLLGIVAGAFRKIGRMGSTVLLAFALFALGYSYWPWLVEGSCIRGFAAGMLIFLILPRRLIRRQETAYQDDREEMKEKIQADSLIRIEETACSIQRLAKSLSSVSDVNEQKKILKQESDLICREMEEKICASCSMCQDCAGDGSSDDILSITKDMVYTIQENGCIREEEIPNAFKARCKNFMTVMEELNRTAERLRLNMNWYGKLIESREAAAEQLNQVSGMMAKVAGEIYRTADITEVVEKEIRKQLKKSHILTRELAVLSKDDKRLEIYLTAKSEFGRCIPVKEAVRCISEALGRRMKVCEEGKKLINKDECIYRFEEDTNFRILHGAARAVKAGEPISGDNFTFTDSENGEMVMALADGMGFGVEAYEESEKVIDLLERFMEAGIEKETAVRLINSIMVLQTEKQLYSTIDIGTIDLYSGVCEFIKLGASAAFIKRDGWVETIQSTTLPVGMFHQVDIDAISKKLYDGDIVIMVTDGVVDAMKGEEKDEALRKIIQEITNRNPQDIADKLLNRVLEECGQVARDDMSILVAGVWKK